LAAIDERFDRWASSVPILGGRTQTDPDVLVAEIDAAVAALYGLDEAAVRVIFETFHEGWDYALRLERVLTCFKDLA
jgi:hypothetical protein